MGSGTVNEICKYAAYLKKKEYIVFPTAPTIAYASKTTSITVNNKKKRVLTNFRRTIKFLFLILILQQSKTKKLKPNIELLKKNYPHHRVCLLKTMKTLL